MKVLCIDATTRDTSTAPCDLVEGETYTVAKKWEFGRDKAGNIVECRLYTLEERAEWQGYEQDRFIPISSIDEKEFQREYNKQLV